MKRLLTTILAVAYLVSLPAFVHAQSSYPASLYFAGVANNQITVSQNFTIDVMANTGGMASSGADVHVDYNPNELTYVSGEFPGLGGNFYPLPAFGPQDGLGSSGMRRVSMARTKQGGGAATVGSGTFAKLTFQPLGQVGSTTTLNFYFTATGATTDSNITSNDAPVDLLGTATPITLTVVQATPVIGGNPVITGISPTYGNKDVSQSVSVFGSGFGVYTEGQSKVYLGVKLVSVLDWADTKIDIQVSAEPDLTGDSTRQVKVHRSDGQEATYVGYTYVVGNLPPSGPETWAWAAVVLAALGLSVLTYRKMAYANSATATDLDGREF